MLITFLYRACYSETGFDIRYGVVGETRDVCRQAAIHLINSKAAVLAEKPKTMDEAVQEMIEQSRANRMANGAAA